MEIRNEVKPSDKEPVEKKKFVVRNASDVQRAKLEKLMKNPEKAIIIPETPRDRDFSNSIPSFVRNVMGSSAGAGSGEFHVYRHLRRKEYARQKFIQDRSRVEMLDDEFQMKLQKNREMAEERTAKKRAKRLKRKAKMKANRGKKPKVDTVESESSNEEEDDDAEVPDENIKDKGEEEGKNDAENASGDDAEKSEETPETASEEAKTETVAEEVKADENVPEASSEAEKKDQTAE